MRLNLHALLIIVGLLFAQASHAVQFVPADQVKVKTNECWTAVTNLQDLIDQLDWCNHTLLVNSNAAGVHDLYIQVTNLWFFLDNVDTNVTTTNYFIGWDMNESDDIKSILNGGSALTPSISPPTTDGVVTIVFPDLSSGAEVGNFGIFDVPVGSVMPWPATDGTVPDRWLVCNGQSLVTNQYTELFSRIGYSYGSEVFVDTNGVTNLNFKVPDYRALFLRGQNAGRSDLYYNPANSLNQSHTNFSTPDPDGIGSLQEDEVDATQVFIQIEQREINQGGGSDVDVYSQGGGDTENLQGIIEGGSAVPPETRPVNATVQWLIKATGEDLSNFTARTVAIMDGFHVDYLNPGTVTVGRGAAYVNGSYYNSSAVINHEVSGLTTNAGWLYIYIDDSESSSSNEVIVRSGTNVPAFVNNATRYGWYSADSNHPGDRVVGVVYTELASSDVKEFNNTDGEYIFKDLTVAYSNAPNGSWQDTSLDSSLFPVNVDSIHVFAEASLGYNPFVIGLQTQGGTNDFVTNVTVSVTNYVTVNVTSEENSDIADSSLKSGSFSASTLYGRGIDRGSVSGWIELGPALNIDAMSEADAGLLEVWHNGFTIER